MKKKLIGKHIVVILIVSLIFSALFSLQALAYPSVRANSIAGCTVYNGPTTSAMVIGSIGIETVSVYWQGDGYYYIEYTVTSGAYGGYKRGYVPVGNINVSGIGTCGYAAWHSRTTSNQTVYNRPTTNSMTIGTVYSTDDTVVLDEDSGWYFILYPASTGWGYKTGYVPKNTMLVVDDYYNGPSSAANISVGGSLSGILNYSGDEDWFYFYASASGPYEMYTTGSTDTCADLYQGSTYLDSNDDGAGYPNFRFHLALSAGNYYYIKVKGHSASSLGSYTLYVKKIDYKGCAIYRDGALLGMDWHAGLMDESVYTDYLPVLHIADPGGPVKWDTWDNFINGNSFRGVYEPGSGITASGRSLIVSIGRSLRTEPITWTPVYQLVVPTSVFSTNTWIYPDDISSLRCDGVVEYCFEYYGYRIYGSDSNWDISAAIKANNDAHTYPNISPHIQTNYMHFLTGNWPW